MELKKFKKGEVIFKEGDYESLMYDIRWGKVGVYTNYGTAEERLLKELEAEEVFGEMGLIDASPRSATAVALEKDVQCAVIDKEDFAEYFRTRPAKIFRIMQLMSQRIRELTQEVESLSQK